MDLSVIENFIFVDLRSLIDAFGSNLIGYCIYNKKNYGDNQKIYFNMERKIHNLRDRVLQLFDDRVICFFNNCDKKN